MARVPSIKTINESFPFMADGTVRKLREAMKKGYSLQSIDSILENYGIEYIRDKNGDVVAKYSNTGDTYAPTVFVVNDNYRITSMGEFVESWQRNHRIALA